MCDKTCIFFFFPIINKYFLMAKRSLLSRCPSYIRMIGSTQHSRQGKTSGTRTVLIFNRYNQYSRFRMSGLNNVVSLEALLLIQ